MTQLVQQGLLVRTETLGRSPVLWATGLLQPVGQEGEIVLRCLELGLQDVTFGRDGFGFGVGASHVSQQ